MHKKFLIKSVGNKRLRRPKLRCENHIKLDDKILLLILIWDLLNKLGK
jgi:hypothetical protein